MELKFSNNASTLLLDNILEGTTVLNILPDTGALFPKLLAPSDYFKVTLVNPGDGSYEIMHVVGVNGDTFTVERAKEHTQAKAFPQNSVVENRLTAGSIEHILNDVSATTTEPGRIRVATAAEVKAGTVTNAAIVPAYAGSLYVPVGVVLAYSGQVDANGFVIDAGTSAVRLDWHVCDGTNGTPDLRDRFIVGTGSVHPINTSGGSFTAAPVITVDDTTLTVAQLASHRHPVGPYSGVNHGQVVDEPWEGHDNASNLSGYTGGSQPHKHTASSAETDITNPYYSLYYIMKIN